MTIHPFTRLLGTVAVTVLATGTAEALHAQPTMHAQHTASPTRADSTPRTPSRPGQDAFGAIAEIVALLRSDSTTDWSKVNIEALRQHLIDMNEVTLHANVVALDVDGGVRLTVTGSGRAHEAIQRMVMAHRHMLMMEGLDGAVELLPAGVRWSVTSTDPKRISELRALSFIGIMTLGDHHTTHHLQLARGETPTAHGH